MLTNKRLIAEIINGEEVIITIDSNMLSCEFGALDRGNLTDIVNWGIYANRGSISFIDNVGYINNQNINTPGLSKKKVRFYIVNKIGKNLISTFDIEDARFDEETRQVDIQLVSPLLKLQTEKLKSSIYPFYETRLDDMVFYVNEASPNTYVNTGSDTKFLYSIIGCPYIEKDTIWNVLTKICQASMSRICENQYGSPEISSSFPNRTPIVVKPKNIIGFVNYDFVKINNAAIDVLKIKKHINKLLDEPKQIFSIKWGEIESNRDILSVEGIEIEEIKKDDILVQPSYKIGRAHV